MLQMEGHQKVEFMWLDLAGLLDRIFGRRGKMPETKSYVGEL